jgi:hypothetical protein
MNSTVNFYRDLKQSSEVIERLALFSDELPLFESLIRETGSNQEEAGDLPCKKDVLMSLIRHTWEEVRFFSAIIRLPPAGDDPEEIPPLSSLSARELIRYWVKYNCRLCNGLALAIAQAPGTEDETSPEVYRCVLVRLQQYLNRVEYLLSQLFS